ncbi:MAG: hypothetical protein IT377_18205 [Polyangiaceae bacterium]|nr:hypothetical protein [Polyangiaceae bacterium]
MPARAPVATAGRTLRDAISRWGLAPLSGSEPSDAVFRWLVGLRWIAVFGVALVLGVTGPLLGLLPAGSSSALWTVLAGLALYNTALTLLGQSSGVPWLTHFAGQIVADCLALAAFVHFSGGVENPFLSLFVLHIINANIVLRPRPASALSLVAVALAMAVVIGEGSGWLPHYCLREAEADCIARSLSPWSLGVLGGLGLMLGSSSYIARYLTARLHDSEERLATTVDDLSLEKERLAETRATIELERSRLQAIIDCMGDAVTFSDPEGRLLLSNDRAKELRRGGDDPFGPESLTAVFDSVAQGREAVTQPAFQRGGRSYEATCAVVRDHHEAPLGLVTVTRDITDRLALERHLMHDERMAVVGKIAAAVAHEINNPIGVVSLYAQHALAKLPPGSPIEKHLETIRRNAESCRKITGDLLQLARPRTPEHALVDLRLLCKDVAQSVEPVAAKYGVVVADESRANAAPLWAEGDAGQLRQAVLNLALNAIEASQEGDRVSLRAYETQDRDVTARVVEVSDTGSGIEPDQLAQIFQPFFTTKPAGTGLGLAVADNIVKGHNGRMTVDSEENRGTTFRILLPSAPARAMESGA